MALFFFSCVLKCNIKYKYIINRIRNAPTLSYINASFRYNLGRAEGMEQPLLEIFNLFFIYFFKFIYLREHACMCWGWAERKGERESQAGCMLSAQSLMQGSVSATMR